MPMQNRRLTFFALVLAFSGIGWGGAAVQAEGFTRPDFEIAPDSGLGDSAALFSDRSSALVPPVPFSITVNFTGDPDFKAAFDQAASTYEAMIPYYRNGKNGFFNFTGLTIEASVVSIDGVGGTLGKAGPTIGATDNGGYLMATEGEMRFDADDFSTPTGSFNEVVLHEMAHVLGIGTLWDDNGLYNSEAAAVLDPNNGESVGRYLGADGLLGWQMEYDADASFVPVEKDGPLGTKDAHWNEGNMGGATGYVSQFTGDDSSRELLTGWLNPNSEIRNVTLGSFRDLGYEVAFVPESSSVLLGLLGCFGFLLRRRR